MSFLRAARYRFCAIIVVCWLANGTTARGQASFFSFQGNFTTTSGAFQDFRFTALDVSNSLYLRTNAWSGGTNLAGEPIAAGGIDSTLGLYLGGPFPVPIAFNDDNAGGLDSLLWYGGSGDTYVAPQPSGNYLLRLANYGDNIGDGHWAVDMSNFDSMTMTSIPSANSTLRSLTFGSPYSTFGLASFDWSSGDLALTETLSVRLRGVLNHSGGSISAANVSADQGTITVTNGAETRSLNFGC